MFLNEIKDKEISRSEVSEILKQTQSSLNGLNNDEVEKRLEKDGHNIIEAKKNKPWYIVLGQNFISMMAILLWVGSIMSFIAGMPELGIAVMLVNIINGLFSFMQEFRASKATEALKKMLPLKAKVRRGNNELLIDASDLVEGDIMLIEEGDKISADGRVIESTQLQVNQSTLTGESNPVRKTSDLVTREDISDAELSNMVFAGTSVSSGSTTILITRTGMRSMFGQIAHLTQSMDEDLSPLQKELNKLTKQISFIALGFGVLFFVLAVFFVNDPIAKSFIFALGMVVAFIPEGLLPTVTLSLAMAVQRMAKENALVKKLSAVETLGCTTVICSDKTGTLTQNEMTVNNLYTYQNPCEVSGLGYKVEGQVIGNKNSEVLECLRIGALCNNAKLIENNQILGDPTEACLLVAALKEKIDYKEINQLFPRIKELPFDSVRKCMSTINLVNQQRIAYTKGAPKEVLDQCSQIMIDDEIVNLSEEMKQEVMNQNDNYAKEGLRVLAMSKRILDDSIGSSLSSYSIESVEHDQVFVGLMVMADLARPEVKKAVELCHQASIKIIMITGDYGLTAESIAKKIGIVQTQNPRVVTGQELETLSNEDLKEILSGEVIFARMAPQQKYRIVSLLQEMDEIVAVTGDGVNDAPALKKADIGISMGITGTDVAKEAADIILIDDNFASIVRAIEEGRGVYQNIRKFLLYILNSNIPEAVPSAFFLLSKGVIPLPLTVMQILAIDLGTDMVPALGLGTEEPESDVMRHKPRSRNEPLLNKNILIKGFLWYGMLEAAISMVAFFFVWLNGGLYEKATTMTLAAIVFSQIGMVHNCRTQDQSVFKVGLFKNRLVNKGILIEIVLIVLLVYVPFLQRIFQTAPLDLNDWLFLICIPLPVILIEEFRKRLSSKKGA